MSDLFGQFIKLVLDALLAFLPTSPITEWVLGVPVEYLAAFNWFCDVRFILTCFDLWLVAFLSFYVFVIAKGFVNKANGFLGTVRSWFDTWFGL